MAPLTRRRLPRHRSPSGRRRARARTPRVWASIRTFPSFAAKRPNPPGPFDQLHRFFVSAASAVTTSCPSPQLIAIALAVAGVHGVLAGAARRSCPYSRPPVMVSSPKPPDQDVVAVAAVDRVVAELAVEIVVPRPSDQDVAAGSALHPHGNGVSGICVLDLAPRGRSCRRDRARRGWRSGCRRPPSARTPCIRVPEKIDAVESVTVKPWTNFARSRGRRPEPRALTTTVLASVVARLEDHDRSLDVDHARHRRPRSHHPRTELEP